MFCLNLLRSASLGYSVAVSPIGQLSASYAPQSQGTTWVRHALSSRGQVALCSAAGFCRDLGLAFWPYWYSQVLPSLPPASSHLLFRAMLQNLPSAAPCAGPASSH